MQGNGESLLLSDMSHASFTLVFEGPAFDDHKIDVRDLAPALLAVGELIDAANQVLNEGAAEVSVQVRAHEAACFSIDLEILQSLIKRGIALLVGDEFTAAVHLKEILFTGVAGAYGLFRLIIWLKGGKPDKIEKLDHGRVRITFKGESIEVPFKLLRLYQDIQVRSAAERAVMKPLEKEGISSVIFKDKSNVLIDVSKLEAPYFKAPEIEDVELTDDIRRSAYSILNLAFKEDNKWRLFDGNNQIHALIEDEEFLRRVDESNISFAKGDILVCDVKVVQKQTGTGLKTEYTVLKVLEHRPALRQLRLKIDPPENND